MNRLARGIDSDDDSSFTGAIGPAEVADPMRTTAVGEFTIVRKGKKFVLRQAQRKHLVDIGKYVTLLTCLQKYPFSLFFIMIFVHAGTCRWRRR